MLLNPFLPNKDIPTAATQLIIFILFYIMFSLSFISLSSEWEAPEGGDISTLTADLPCHTTETKHCEAGVLQLKINLKRSIIAIHLKNLIRFSHQELHQDGLR